MLLHPPIVHFPIALLFSAAIFALLSLFAKRELFKEIVFWNLLFGVISAIAAVLTGLLAEQNLIHNEEIHELLEKHEFNGFAIAIAFLILLSWLWIRKNKFGKREYITWVILLVFGAAMITYQGWLGGEMVFQQGAGVKPLEPIFEMQGNERGSHSHNESDEQATPSHDSMAHDGTMEHMHESKEHTHDSTNPDMIHTNIHKHDKHLQDIKKSSTKDSLQKEKKPKVLKGMKY